MIDPSIYNWELLNSFGIQKGILKNDDTKIIYRHQGNKINTYCYFYDISAIDLISYKSYATPQQYGAKGDGITDDTAALTQCFAENKSILLYGDYLLSSYIEITANQKVYSDNAIVRRNSTNSSTFIANNSDGWQIDGKLEIIGAGKANGSASAINVVGCRRFDIRGVTIRNMSGYGINIQNGSDSLPRGEGGLIINCWLIDNWYGIETKAGAEGEYNCINNCNFTGNNTAMSVNAGNTTIIGGNIVDNNVGLFVGGDLATNGAHGIVSGVNINHNTLNLYCYNVDLGHTFDGCHFYGETSGSIKLENTIGASFVNCIIDGKVEIISGSLSGVNSFVSNQIEPSFSLTGSGANSCIFTANFTKNTGYSPLNDNKTINIDRPSGTPAILIKQSGVDKIELGQVGDDYYVYNHTLGDTVLKGKANGSVEAHSNDGGEKSVVRNSDLYAETSSATMPTKTILDTAYGDKPNGFRVYYSAFDRTYTKSNIATNGWFITDVSQL